MYQWIDEDICFADIVWSQKNLISQLINFIVQTAHFSKNFVLTEEFMNIDNKNVQQYTSTEFNEWKKWTVKSKCFDCEQKKHLHRNCSTNFYNKIWQVITINLNVNIWIILIFKIYVMSVNNEVKLLNIFTVKILISCESENKSFWNQVTFQNSQSKNEKR